MAEQARSSWVRWLPLGLAIAALVALLGALGSRSGTAMGFLGLFVVLLPLALATALIRWWPWGYHDLPDEDGTDWRRILTLGGAGLLLAAVITLVLGVAWTGGRLGNMLLVAGALLLPPAALVAAFGWLLGRHGTLERELDADEEISYRAREHWGVFLPVLVAIAATVIVLILPLGPLGTGLAAVLYLLVLPGLGVSALSNYLNTEFALTNRHLIFVHGLLRRRIERLPLSQVAACGVNRNWFGRMLGYGKLTVICEDGRTYAVRGMDEPEALRRKLAQRRSGG